MRFLKEYFMLNELSRVVQSETLGDAHISQLPQGLHIGLSQCIMAPSAVTQRP